MIIFNGKSSATGLSVLDNQACAELASVKLNDQRLTKRLKVLLDQLSQRPGASIPFACQDWANTKAAYRFLSNPRVDEGQIMRGHFEATKLRFDALCACNRTTPVLILHDTTEVSYRWLENMRQATQLLGQPDQ